MRRSYLRKTSSKSRATAEAARPVREWLLARFDRCMICGHSGRFPHPGKPPECSRLSVHEIANGQNRQKSLNQPYALLVLCWYCNEAVVTDKSLWPQARQLAKLQEKNPEDYDLKAFNYLVNPRAPNRITQVEVDHWREYGKDSISEPERPQKTPCWV